MVVNVKLLSSYIEFKHLYAKIIYFCGTCLPQDYLYRYCKDRLNNSVSLSPSLCRNSLPYLAEENSTNTVLKGRQTKLGIIALGTNKDQLLH